MCSSRRESKYFRDRAEAGLTWSLDQAEGIFPQSTRIRAKPGALSAVSGEQAHAFCFTPTSDHDQPWFQRVGCIKHMKTGRNHLQTSTTKQFVNMWLK